MTTEECLERFGIVPPDDALPQIRALLARETDAERCGAARHDDLALLCCVQLFSRGQLDDVLRIWEAKQAGNGLHAALDVQLLCGAGLKATKAYLAARNDAAAIGALDHLIECEDAGDFEHYSPARQLRDYKDYFDVA